MTFERCTKGVKRGTPLTIIVDGEKIEAYAGETVASAMLTAGKYQMAESDRTSSPKGVFCGIGVCYNCMVTIDGVPDRQACQTEVRDQMVVNTKGVKGCGCENL